jgi:hypothetical protein
MGVSLFIASLWTTIQENYMKADCPREELLADYMAGRLNDEKRIEIESHVADCDQCLDEMALLQDLESHPELTRSETVPDKVMQAALELVKKEMRPKGQTLLRQTAASYLKKIFKPLSDQLEILTGFNTAPAAVRSSAANQGNDHIIIRKVLSNITVEIEKTGHQSVLIRVILEGKIQTQTNIRVILMKPNNREVASCLLQEGVALLEDIPFGKYILVFARDAKIIDNYPFEIKESPHE